MNKEALYQVTCADCISVYGGFETKREAREWLIEHEAFHAGETTEAQSTPPGFGNDQKAAGRECV